MEGSAPPSDSIELQSLSSVVMKRCVVDLVTLCCFFIVVALIRPLLDVNVTLDNEDDLGGVNVVASQPQPSSITVIEDGDHNVPRSVSMSYSSHPHSPSHTLHITSRVTLGQR